MKTRLFLLLLLAAATVDAADTNILKKDGTTVVAKAMRRQGDNIMATVEMPVKPGDPVTTGEIGLPLGQIQKIDFPEPAILKTAQEPLQQGKGAEVLPRIEEAARFYEGFRDAPGSWWADVTLLKMNALYAVGRQKEAFETADAMARLATDPESQRIARMLLAAAAIDKGNAQPGVDALAVIMREASKPAVLASAAIYRGRGYLALNDFENALICFLQIPVLYPEQKMFYPTYQLGAGRCHFGFGDFATARTTLDEVIKTYGATPEASEAKATLELIAKREKALAMPN